MAAAVIKTKTFTSLTLEPLATPDGSSLEEQVNTFLATLPINKVQDVSYQAAVAGKLGTTATYYAFVTYQS